jgi:hypothetical protein
VESDRSRVPGGIVHSVFPAVHLVRGCIGASDVLPPLVQTWRGVVDPHFGHDRDRGGDLAQGDRGDDEEYGRAEARDGRTQEGRGSQAVLLTGGRDRKSEVGSRRAEEVFRCRFNRRFKRCAQMTMRGGQVGGARRAFSGPSWGCAL